MLVFRNPGLIDLEAIRTLGVSVKQPGSFGRFGTGLKFALATILRGGGEITVFRGLNEHRIGSVEKEIRGTLFQIVTLDDEPIGFTTELGKDWEPWMVLRELGCNALDETGSFGSTLSSVYETFIDPMPAEDSTVILVTWEALETAYRQRKELFLEGTELWKNNDLRILSGPSSHIFYRGIRVFKLEKPTLFTYDILAEQILTEDRTLSSLWRFNGLLRDAFYSMKDSTLIGQALTTSSGYHEHSIDYGDVSYGVKSSKEFIDAAHQAREAKKLTSESAKKVLLKSIRSSTEETSTFGSYRRVVDDSFTYAIEQLGSLGMKFTETQSFVILDELSSEGTLSMIEDGRIYILRDLTKRPAREIAGELLKRWVDLNIDGYGMDDAVTLLTPFLLGKLKTMKEDEALVREDEVLAKEEVEPETEPEKRYVLEGTWRGYRSHEDRVVHRKIIGQSLADKIGDAYSIRYGDGTELVLNIRDLKPDEAVTEIDGYTSLIRECAEYGVWSVNGLQARKDAKIVPPMQLGVMTPTGDEIPF